MSTDTPEWRLTEAERMEIRADSDARFDRAFWATVEHDRKIREEKDRA
jgi:hypothetical protein